MFYKLVKQAEKIRCSDSPYKPSRDYYAKRYQQVKDIQDNLLKLANILKPLAKKKAGLVLMSKFIWSSREVYKILLQQACLVSSEVTYIKTKPVEIKKNLVSVTKADAPEELFKIKSGHWKGWTASFHALVKETKIKTEKKPPGRLYLLPNTLITMPLPLYVIRGADLVYLHPRYAVVFNTFIVRQSLGLLGYKPGIWELTFCPIYQSPFLVGYSLGEPVIYILGTVAA